jgi:hypothetical protein
MRKLPLIAPKRLRPRLWLADIMAKVIITITIMRQLPKVALRPRLKAALRLPLRLKVAPRLLLRPRRNRVSQFV